MNIIKKFFTLSLLISSAYISNAQNGMSEPVDYTLKNGMKIIISENSRSNGAFSSFTLDSKSFQNKKDGIVELLNAVLNEQVAKSGSISFKDNSGRLSTSNANLTEELTKMAAVIQNATIDQKTFNIGKAKLLTNLKLKDYDFDQAVNEESISALTLSDVQAFYNEISPEKTFLTVAGDIELANAKAAVKTAFGSWKKNSTREMSTEAK